MIRTIVVCLAARLFVPLIGFAALPAPALAQGTPAPGQQGPLVVERVHNPFVVAPDYKVTDLNDDLGQLAGAYVGTSIEETLFFGAGAYWLVNGSRGDELAYGGGIVGWSFPVAGRIRLGTRGLVGFGSATLGTDVTVTRGGVRGIDARGIRGGDLRGTPATATVRVRARDDFFVFEPQVDALARVASFLGVRWAAGYRLAGLTDALEDRLNGATGSVALQFQW
jgi:hypothetical protein